MTTVSRPAPRVLILSASVGAGHLRAAQAVELALRQLVPDAQVRNLDVMELTNATFRRVYATSYLDLVNRAPHVLGYLYDQLDRPSQSGKQRGDRLRLAVETLNLRRLIRLLESDPVDLVINTHFLPAEIIAHLRKQGRLDVPQTTACTDFETHRLWVNQPCERFFTATEEGAVYLARCGVPPEAITPTGIPIHPAFSTPQDREALLKAHELAGDRPIILQMAGGFGTGPIERLYRAILEIPQPLQVIAVAGKNEALQAQLAAVPCPPQHRTRVIGFTSAIHELMAVADLLVSKPGGLTTSEALASGTVLAIVNPTPGQETRNSDFLLENGAAIKVNQIATLAYKVDGLLRDRERFARLKAAARALGRPRAAFEVVEQSLQLIRQPTEKG